MRWIMHAKIHNAKITDISLDKEEGLFIDRDIIDKAGFWEGEHVMIGNLGTGDHFDSVIRFAPNKSGSIIVSGSAARLVNRGNRINIIGKMLTDIPISSRIIILDDNNKVISK